MTINKPLAITLGLSLLAGGITLGTQTQTQPIATWSGTQAAMVTKGEVKPLDTDHQELINTVEAAGFPVSYNTPECWEDGVKTKFGWVNFEESTMTICQENSTRPGQMVAFTAEDLDTIRHEAIHVAQDMVDGKADGMIQTTLDLEAHEWDELLKENVTRPERLEVLEDYRAEDEWMYYIEGEAEAWAAGATASEVNDHLSHFVF